MRRLSLVLVVVLSLALAPALLPAQQPAGTTPPLEIGAVAPDFSLPGATRYGVLAHPVRLSDFKGETVVLAFFFKARTKG
jgi:thioredoxin-dependent peroxiredoxin